jgi:hypothetical protein
MPRHDGSIQPAKEVGVNKQVDSIGVDFRCVNMGVCQDSHCEGREPQNSKQARSHWSCL